MRRGGKFWAWAWRRYDTKLGVRIFGPGIAPWLFGMMLGFRGEPIKREDLPEALQ